MNSAINASIEIDETEDQFYDTETNIITETTVPVVNETN